MRVGIGYDIHRLKKGGKLRLGGVTIPFSKGLVGHSDADVVLHAVVDAVLGALGEGDIGSHFPDSDPRYRGVSSAFFAQKTSGWIHRRGWQIENVDCTIVAEEPRLAPYREKIRKGIAETLKISSQKVNVKAKTNEGLGPVGQKQAILCLAVASVARKGKHS